MPLTKTEFRLQLNSKLEGLSGLLKLKEKQYNKGISLCENFRTFLEKQTKKENFAIVNAFYGGNIGDKDDPNSPDFHIVLQVTNCQPPEFQTVLDFIENVIKLNCIRLEVMWASIHARPNALNFWFEAGINVYLTLAVENLTPEDIIQKMRKNTKNWCYYSNSPIQLRNRFIKAQSELAQDLARIARFWFQSMYLCGAYVGQGSRIFELLAVAAVQKQKNEVVTSATLLVAFTQLIELVEQLDKQKIMFEKSCWSGWKLAEFDVKDQPVPYILEPGNIAANWLQGINSGVMNSLKFNGVYLHGLVKRLLNTREFCTFNKRDGSLVSVDFNALFPYTFE